MNLFVLQWSIAIYIQYHAQKYHVPAGPQKLEYRITQKDSLSPNG